MQSGSFNRLNFYTFKTSSLQVRKQPKNKIEERKGSLQSHVKAKERIHFWLLERSRSQACRPKLTIRHWKASQSSTRIFSDSSFVKSTISSLFSSALKRQSKQNFNKSRQMLSSPSLVVTKLHTVCVETFTNSQKMLLSLSSANEGFYLPGQGLKCKITIDRFSARKEKLGLLPS